MTGARIDEATLRRAIGEPDFSRGRNYFRLGKVLSVAVDAAGVVSGSVYGSGGRRYSQRIALTWGRDGALARVRGECSCPVGHNCKHVAALILAAADRLAPPEPASPAPSHRQRPAGDGLAGPVSVWLRQLSEAKQAAPKPVSAEKLLYVLKVDQLRGALITPIKARILKDGGVGSNPSEYTNTNSLSTPPKFMTLEDVGVLQKLASLRSSFRGAYNWPEGEALFALLREVIGTGRARGFTPEGAALHWAAPRKARPEWRMDEEGRQRLMLIAEDGAPLEPLPFPPPLYIDRETGACGPLETGLAPRIAALAAAAPAVPAQEAPIVAERLSGTGAALPQPQHIQLRERKGVPEPVLRLFGWPLRIPAHPSRGYAHYGQMLEMLVPGARPAFDYGERRVSLADRGDPTVTEEGEVVVIRRDSAREATALERLGALRDYEAIPIDEARLMGELRLEDAHSGDWMFPPIGAPDQPQSGEPALAFSAELIPALRAEGWRVELEESWPFRLHEGPVGFHAGTESSGIDWFSFSLTLTAGDETLDLLPIILSIIEFLPLDGDGALPEDLDLDEFLETLVLYPQLESGARVRLEAAQFAPIVRAFLEAHGLTGFHIAEAPQLRRLAETLEGCGVPWRGDRRLFDLAERLNALAQTPEADPPGGLTASLRPYQRTGYGWLKALSETGFGGVLADDMGLGKTVQALALLAHRHLEAGSDRPSLLVAPTSMVGVWAREAARFVPDLKVLVLQGPQRKTRFGAIPEHHLVVTTYPLLHRDHAALFAQPYDLAILDEAQAVKNPASSAARRIREIEARQRLALTGTPVENNLQELWAIFDWLVPGLLGDRSRFAQQIRRPIERDGSGAAQKLLNARIRPFLLRRTKEEVAADLPPKTVIDDVVPLGSRQSALYETLRIAMDARVKAAIREKGVERSRITILDALLKLRQACCDPALVKLDSARKVAESAKRARLMELLEELMAEGRKVLVFSQFVEMLKLIEADVKAQGWRHTILTGRTRKRAEAIARFQEGDADLFLISLKAGGTGLTLTEADTVILYDPWWNPAAERQAMDRAHRIGQTRPVFVHRLIAEGTVEEAIQQMQAKKQALADALFDEGGGARLDLGEDDIAALFAPMG